MGGIGVWQLIFIALIIAPAALCTHFIRKGQKGDLARPLRFLNWSFAISVIGIVFVVLAVALPLPLAGPNTSMMFTVVMLPMMWAGWTFLVALAVLAKRSKRSPIVWVGLTFITAPIGLVIAFPMMRSRVRCVGSNE